jgi:hypothetical protein
MDDAVWIALLLAISIHLGIATVEVIKVAKAAPIQDYFAITYNYQMYESEKWLNLSVKFARPGISRIKIFFDETPSELEIAVAINNSSVLMSIYQNRKPF